jgi:hypothetical protein
MLVVVAARPVGAFPRASERPAQQASTKVPGDAIGLSLSQVASSGLAINLDAGQSQEHTLLISNFTADLRLSVRLTASDATGVLGAGPAAWVAFADEVVQLEPHAATSIAMTVAVPNATQPGPALVHIAAAVETAVAAADGAPRTGTARVSLPVSLVVKGAATAQIAIVDVSRVDRDAEQQLAVVLRNFSNEPVKVDGSVRVGSDYPQTLALKADLPAARDTTVKLDWKKVPKRGAPLEITIDLSYGNDDTAQWSSVLGAPPTTFTAADPGAATNASTTVPATDKLDDINNVAADRAGTVPKPWWKSGGMPMLIGLGVLLAAGWFFFEWKRSRKREEMLPPYGISPGMVVSAPGSDAAAELAKQLVRLTEIIVDLTTNRDGARLETRVRGPDPPADPSPTAVPTNGGGHESALARAGPTVEDRGPPEPAGDIPAASPDALTERDLSSASVTPGIPARPDTEMLRALLAVATAAESEPEPESESGPEPETEPEPDPRDGLLERLRELDRGRRELRQWMDEQPAAATDGGEALPADRTLFVNRPDGPPES